jgi:hypothetical protein
MKLVESVEGTVRMADGTTRPAYRNTYRGTENSADGTTFRKVEDVRIEFKLFTNINLSSTRKWRKASAKQAASFVA